MIHRYSTQDTETLKTALLSRTQFDFKDINASVKEIIETVKQEGDDALMKYAKQFDGVALTTLKVPKEALKAAYEALPETLLKAFTKAKDNLTRYHEQQREPSFVDEEDGIIRAQRITPIDRVGLYIPGGSAAYPSSVLMNVIPAQIAGVKQLVMVTPPQKSGVNPTILALAYWLGIDEVYQVGGAQAIAALAYGTETIPKVDKVVGPGNIYVATAKKQLLGTIGIDSFAGPSEVIILADPATKASYVAADMIAQAEHDALASAITFSTDQSFLDEVEKELTRQVPLRDRQKVIEASLKAYGALVHVHDFKEAIEWVNVLAPEHLQLMYQDAENDVELIRNAGAIFIGAYTPEAVGDYIGGTNHTLPTSSTARFASGLSTYDFYKRTSVLKYDAKALKRVIDDIDAMAKEEGLDGHAYSATIRKDDPLDQS